jgi:hypothetical protein
LAPPCQRQYLGSLSASCSTACKTHIDNHADSTDQPHITQNTWREVQAANTKLNTQVAAGGLCGMAPCQPAAAQPAKHTTHTTKACEVTSSIGSMSEGHRPVLGLHVSQLQHSLCTAADR